MDFVWTSAAAQDYLSTEVHNAEKFAITVNDAISVLEVFPEMGAPIKLAPRLRRLLVGSKRQYGIYYGLTGNRVVIVALLSLRRDPAAIEAIPRQRLP